MLSDKGVGRQTAGIWPGMTASQRNEKWTGLRKLTGKRQEFAVLVLRLRWGLREVLGLGETVASCTRLRVTFQSDSVLQASECVFVCVERSGVYKAHLEEPRSTSVGVPSSDVRAFWKKCEKQLWTVKRSKPPSDSRTATLLMWCCRRAAVVSKCAGGLPVSERGPQVHVRTGS